MKRGGALLFAWFLARLAAGLIWMSRFPLWSASRLGDLAETLAYRAHRLRRVAGGWPGA